MRNYWLLPLLIGSCLPTMLNAQAMPWTGHWVNVDASDFPFFAVAFTSDGHVHRLMPAPQFQATYRLDGENLVMRAGDGSVDTSMVARGDTIVARRGPFVRVPGTSSGPYFRGTWVPVTPGPMETFMTLRSDSQVVLEVGFPVEASVHADTLRLTSSRLPAASFTVRQSGDTLYTKDSAGKERRFVRRPWGCLGIATFDAPAKECH